MNGGLLEWARYYADRDALVVKLSTPLRVVTTLPHQPGRTGYIVFKKVPESFRCDSIASFYRRVRRSMGLREAVVFLTAAEVDRPLHEVIDEPETHIIATVGLKPPACPGGTAGAPRPGTINIAVATSAGLSRAGAIDLLRVVAEAKAAAAAEALLPCLHRATGTATDAIAVLHTPGATDFSGFYTRLGGLVGRSLYFALVDAAVARRGPDSLLRALTGMSMEGLLELFRRVYMQSPIPGVPVEEALGRAGRMLERMMRDPNVAALLIAARELDLHGSAGAIPGLSRSGYKGDSKAIVADELLAAALAEYLAGFKGLLATIWVEKLKSMGLADAGLPMFMDDMVSAVVGSLVSRLHDEVREG
ncbi:alpha-ribazole phosphatase CobZ [Aeropyrum pernix]|uniref:alpha-ribazole phosphatase CobZ n=1 Tax=Aeropyrum pernix TaxID=56636 RepID=UPI0011E56F36|nr:alpha-ribazole phosphatase CobZ [Aeropyrum pernix]